MAGVICLFVFLAVVGGAIWLSFVMAARRARELEGFARSVGFTFDKGPFMVSGGPFAAVSQFQVFHEGVEGTFTNVARGQVDDAEVQIFDYQYEDSDRLSVGNVIDDVLGIFGPAWRRPPRNRQTYKFTAAMFTSSGGTRFPKMELSPEGLFSKIGSAFGGQDIDLPEFPEFSSRFVLRSLDEITVRAMFDRPTAEFFENHINVTVSTDGPSLLFYRANQRVGTADAKLFFDIAVCAYRTLADAAARRAGTGNSPGLPTETGRSGDDRPGQRTERPGSSPEFDY